MKIIKGQIVQFKNKEYIVDKLDIEGSCKLAGLKGIVLNEDLTLVTPEFPFEKGSILRYNEEHLNTNAGSIYVKTDLSNVYWNEHIGDYVIDHNDLLHECKVLELVPKAKEKVKPIRNIVVAPKGTCNEMLVKSGRDNKILLEQFSLYDNNVILEFYIEEVISCMPHDFKFNEGDVLKDLITSEQVLVHKDYSNVYFDEDENKYFVITANGRHIAEEDLAKVIKSDTELMELHPDSNICLKYGSLYDIEQKALQKLDPFIKGYRTTTDSEYRDSMMNCKDIMIHLEQDRNKSRIRLKDCDFSKENMNPLDIIDQGVDAFENYEDNPNWVNINNLKVKKL